MIKNLFYASSRESLSKPFILRVQNAKPFAAGDARVRLILEPSCTYKIRYYFYTKFFTKFYTVFFFSIRLHIIGVFGQLARYYSTFLISTLAVIFLLAFQSQIHQIGETGRVPIFFSSLFHGSRQIWIVVVTYFVSVAL